MSRGILSSWTLVSWILSGTKRLGRFCLVGFQIRTPTSHWKTPNMTQNFEIVTIGMIITFEPLPVPSGHNFKLKGGLTAGFSALFSWHSQGPRFTIPLLLSTVNARLSSTFQFQLLRPHQSSHYLPLAHLTWSSWSLSPSTPVPPPRPSQAQKDQSWGSSSSLS